MNSGHNTTMKPRKTLAEIRRIRSEAGKKGAAARNAQLALSGGKQKVNFVKLEKEVVREQTEQFFMRGLAGIREAQMSLARGVSLLYRIDKTWIKTGRSKDGEEQGYWRNEKPVLVTMPEEIEAYLAGEHDDDSEDASYYYITTKVPDGDAIKNIQDRVLGKPTETQVVDINHNFSLVGLAARRAPVHLSAPDVQVLPPPAVEERAAE